jgi:hypothetical protein
MPPASTIREKKFLEVVIREKLKLERPFIVAIQSSTIRAERPPLLPQTSIRIIPMPPILPISPAPPNRRLAPRPFECHN